MVMVLMFERDYSAYLIKSQLNSWKDLQFDYNFRTNYNITIDTQFR